MKRDWRCHQENLYDKVHDFLDPIVAAIMLILLMPILLLVSLAAVIDSPGSPLFIQQRIGFRGRAFRMFKFRTMVPGDHQHELPRACGGEIVLDCDSQLITRSGRFLRTYGIDELPQLVNVILGDMHFIGPRPELPRYYELVTGSAGRRRQSVKPGITGLAQSHGRNELSVSQRVELDLAWLEHRSLKHDLALISSTLGTISGRKGVSHPPVSHQTKSIL